MTTTARPTAPRGAYLRAGLLAVSIAVLAGALAGWARGDEFWLVAGVFAACTLGPAAGIGWLLFVSDHTVEPDARAEESIEKAWLDRAMIGTCTDLVVAAGVALALTSVLDLDVSGRAVLLAVVLGVGADTFVRYLVMSRRES